MISLVSNIHAYYIEQDADLVPADPRLNSNAALYHLGQISHVVLSKSAIMGSNLIKVKMC